MADAIARCSDLLDHVEMQTATTLDGLLVKMQAHPHCVCDDPITMEKLITDRRAATNQRLMVAILADLNAMRRAVARRPVAICSVVLAPSWALLQSA